MRFFNSIFVALSLFVGLTLTSCKNVMHSAVKAQIDKANEELPVDLSEGISFDSAGIDSESVYFYYSLSEAMSNFNVGEHLNSDNSLAAAMKKNKSLYSEMVFAKLGLTMVTKLKETGDVIKTKVIDAERIDSIYKKLNTGDVEAASFLEITQQEIDNTQFPIQVGEMVYFTNMYIDGSKICYEYKIDVEQSAEELELAESDIEGERQEVLGNLQNNVVFQNRKNEIKSEVSAFSYTYKNVNGEYLYSYEITPKEIFPDAE